MYLYHYTMPYQFNFHDTKTANLTLLKFSVQGCSEPTHTRARAHTHTHTHTTTTTVCACVCTASDRQTEITVISNTNPETGDFFSTVNPQAS